MLVIHRNKKFIEFFVVLPLSFHQWVIGSCPRTHDHKTFEYKFYTHTPKSSNQKATSNKYIILISQIWSMSMKTCTHNFIDRKSGPVWKYSPIVIEISGKYQWPVVFVKNPMVTSTTIFGLPRYDWQIVETGVRKINLLIKLSLIIKWFHSKFE